MLFRNNLFFNYDLIVLDISLPSSNDLKLNSGLDLGVLIKKHNSKATIIVCTFHNEFYLLTQIMDTINPRGFIHKQDVDFLGIVSAIRTVLQGRSHYSTTIIDQLKYKFSQFKSLDKFDVLILQELANGSKMRDLLRVIPLSKSGIEKRKRILKERFQVVNNSDRDLVIRAKKEGYI